MLYQDPDKTTHFTADLNATGKEIFVSIFDGEKEPKVVNLRSFRRNRVSFGRNPDNDIVLQSKLVSRYHGYFYIESNLCTIEDNNSTNGLILNGARISSHFLGEGDRIRIDDFNEPTVKGVMILFGTASREFVWDTFDIGERQVITIGRDPACDIHLDHMSVSKIHARIEKQDDEYYLIDAGSTNGISVAGIRVENRIRLHEKDLILITNSKLTFTRQRISYYVFKTGFGLDAVDLVRSIKTKNGNKNICNHISLSISPCEFVAIIGGSGAGKSTFMNCISGYVKATSGSTIVNGEDLYNNYETIKSIIGYVPQQDIVYDNLSLDDMLEYAARLRMPKDTTASERAARIGTVIEMIELKGHERTLIGHLSGGQKKRASIAVELLSDPNLFFLDEPTSGLDPGTERNLMRTLQRLSRAGKTIILVTHNTLNLHLCDKIIFLGSGGNLCFCGSYSDALMFFEVDNLVPVYNMLSEDAQRWKSNYDKSHFRSLPQNQPSPNKSDSKATRIRVAVSFGQFWLQISVLSKRYAHLLINDRQRILLLFLQPPILALLISLVSDGQEFEQYEMTKSILFALSCAAFWIGIMNAIQEICKERVILKREYMTGLMLSAYVGSKFVILCLISALQAFLLLLTFMFVVGIPEDGILTSAFFEMFLSTFLSIYAAAGLGIFVSSVFKNADRAMTVAPILVLPQILYSGIIFKLSGATEQISLFASCRWTMECYGSIADLNGLPVKAELDGITLFAHEFEDYFERTPDHLISTWLILFGFVILFSLVSLIVLRSIKND